MTGSREQQFHVYLYEQLIGRLHRRDNLTWFVFEPDYWIDPERLVLGLRFEEDRKARHRKKMRLPPWFSNLLPEGRLRDRKRRCPSEELVLDLFGSAQSHPRPCL